MKENYYEFIFLARQDVSQAQAKTLAEEFQGILESNGGSVSKIEYCGLLNTAYPVKKNRKAHYVLLNVTATAQAMDELVRQVKLNNDVIRHLRVQVDKLQDEPSPLTQTKSYQERFEQRKQDDRNNERKEQTHG